MAILSRQEARVIVGKIREDNGGISPEDRAACPPAVLRALENVRRKLGAATKTLATNLYSKDTRFVYELIQNAEDNKYTRAEAAGEELYLRFSIYPGKIVIDSNEDGFQEKHVRAICSTGESMKAAAQGYIGEKGIGFKSVFKVARNVHIQSGTFSFSFEHTRDSSDDGLGMVTPLDADFGYLPTDVHTRITLTLLDPSTFGQRKQDLLNIPETLLLFLSKLDALEIIIHPKNQSSTTIRYTHDSDEDDTLETITKMTTIDGSSVTKTKHFHVTRRETRHLPRDDARKNIDNATVVLAFPLDEEEVPIIEQQHVFAYLPLRLAGFTFLIQSDFITQASREDVFHSTRNQKLLDAVAKTFRDAVLEFCKHPTLQYQWMRYLPSDTISDEFWRTLRPKIISELERTPCLRSWSKRSLFLPRQLHLVGESSKDQYGEPLLADSAQETYLSGSYTLDDMELLMPLGTSKDSYSFRAQRLAADLSNDKSRMKAATTDKDWHTRTAKLFSVPLAKAESYFDTVRTLRLLELIPLQDCRWVSSKALLVYFPTTGTISIPTDLGLNLVQQSATSNAARKAFFVYIGVRDASPDLIIRYILQKYVQNWTATFPTITSHIRYLYWNLPENVSTLPEKVFLIDQHSKRFSRVEPVKKYLYFEEKEDEYGPWQLLGSNAQESQELNFHFLHENYADVVPSTALHRGRSWKTWLRDMAGVKAYPQLRTPNKPELSDEFKHIISEHPEKLVGLLKHHWSLYEPDLNTAISIALKESWVPSEGNLANELQQTFLPTAKLKGIVKTLRIARFPFLVLPEEIYDDKKAEWKFLKRFGVGSHNEKDMLHFYITALGRIISENPLECNKEILESLFEIYAAIEKNCTSSSDVKLLQDHFKSNAAIYIPSTGDTKAAWVKSESCVWTAPEWLKAKKRLDGVLKYEKYQMLFRVNLRIQNATWEHYLEDLLNMKEQNTETSRVTEIYQHLRKEFLHDSKCEILRKHFEDSRLVFAPSQNTWHPLSSCIWADDQVRIPRKASLKTAYGLLEDFFCKMLGVQKPNLSMHVQALKELSQRPPPPPFSEIKRMMKVISNMSPTAEEVAILQRSKIFLVTPTNGPKSLTDSTSEFAIVDRSEFATAFAGKINILDLSLEEARACSSLLLALGLKRLHLSELVKEVTTVPKGVVDAELTQTFHLKAYALFRCAVHYHSPKARDEDKSLYNELLKARIYISDGISKSLSVTQYGVTITAKSSRANFHLDGNNEELKLYMPGDETLKEECFSWQLPRGLMAYLAISDPTAQSLLVGMFACKSLVSIDNMLREAGIVEIPGIERPSKQAHEMLNLISRQTPTKQTPPTGTDTQLSDSIPASLSFSMQSLKSALFEIEQSAEDDPNSASVETQSSVVSVSARPSLASPFSFSMPLVPTPSQDQRPRSSLDHHKHFGTPDESSTFSFSMPLTQKPPIQDTGYIALLNRVINSAARISLPTQGNVSLDTEIYFAPDSHSGIGLFESVFMVRNVERDRKVGAAGELLVFEILLKLGLPGFSRSNWKSTIRKQVCIHDKYRDMMSWQGRETADITYSDTSGEFTKLLRDKEYLQGEIWRDQRPTYYLEVKTTTRDCSEQFYMSGSQYQRMQDMELSSERATPNVYVILRVFNIEGRIGLRIYVDPESCRVNRELDFKVDTWAVKTVPGLPN